MLHGTRYPYPCVFTCSAPISNGLNAFNWCVVCPLYPFNSSTQFIEGKKKLTATLFKVHHALSLYYEHQHTKRADSVNDWKKVEANNPVQHSLASEKHRKITEKVNYSLTFRSLVFMSIISTLREQLHQGRGK